jgi:orotate phosphoribosyltransferase
VPGAPRLVVLVTTSAVAEDVVAGWAAAGVPHAVEAGVAVDREQRLRHGEVLDPRVKGLREDRVV